MAIPEAVIDSATALYNIKDSTIKPLHGGHFSHVYSFNQDSASFVLRLTPPSTEINISQMQAILEWMQYLAVKGASVSRPILSIEDNLIEEIEQGGQSYLAAVLEAADGILSEDMPLENWNDDLYQVLGSAIGRIHALSTQYHLQETARLRPEWDRIPNNFNPESVQDSDISIILSERRKVVEYLKSVPKDDDSFGLIHGDLHMGNFFIDTKANKITIFDFDDCVYGWFMMDIATLIFDFPVVYPQPEENGLVENFIAHLLEGYLSEKPTVRFWINQLPHFLKLLEIGIYLQVYRLYDPQEDESWIGKFMPGRKSRIEQRMPYLNIDFEQFVR